MNIQDELKMYFQKIEQFDKDTADDINACHAYLVELTNIQARANSL